ncbi:alpha keto acid dehydrogenase [Streptomyces sp. e14]|nr:alpha keto acid dehydrogenase [Streptomyces sp. e14]
MPGGPDDGGRRVVRHVPDRVACRACLPRRRVHCAVRHVPPGFVARGRGIPHSDVHERSLRCRGSRRGARRLHRRGACRSARPVHRRGRGEVLGRGVPERGLHPLQGPAAQRRVGAHRHPAGRDVRDPVRLPHHVRLRRGLQAQPGRGGGPGGRRALPDAQEQDHRERVVTYEEQILTEELPGSIVIAGAGAIGVEFAYVLHNYGVKVTVVEFADRIVPAEDADVSKELAKHYRKLGIEVHTSTRVESIDDSDPARPVRVTVDKNGARQVLEADKVLQAIGFAPRVTGYGLETTGVRLTDRGAIEVDGRGRTNVPSLYAIGDVTGKLMLAHAAETMGVIAAETIGGAETMEVDFRMIPRATYCQPQIASFGHTEAQAREAGFDVQVAKFPFTANGKAHGLGEPVGFVKVISDGAHGELLGAHLIGPEVTELLPELTLAQQWDLTVHEVARNVHAHPTLGEAVKEAVHGLAGHMINM